MNNFILYRHIRPDKDQVFYIGIGTHTRSVDFRRARNRHWQHIFEKNNRQIEVEVMLDELTWNEACKLEKWWIAFYGRADLKRGALCNMTDGGDGTAGPKSLESTAKRIAKITGRPLSKEHKNKLRESKLGADNPMFGNPNIEALKRAHFARRKKVQNTETGEIFDSINAAAKTTKHSAKYLTEVLAGRKINNTNLIKL